MAAEAEEFVPLISGETIAAIRATHDRKELLELYKAAVEEYRFEVRLNWTRTQYFIVVISSIIAAGTGLFARANSWEVATLCGLIFLIGAAMSVVALAAIKRGREYYRATIFKKTLYEEVLGLNRNIVGLSSPLATLAIATTDGQRRMRAGGDVRIDVPWHKLIWRNKVVSYFVWVLILLAVINLFAMLAAGVHAVALLRNPVSVEINEEGTASVVAPAPEPQAAGVLVGTSAPNSGAPPASSEAALPTAQPSPALQEQGSDTSDPQPDTPEDGE